MESHCCQSGRAASCVCLAIGLCGEALSHWGDDGHMLFACPALADLGPDCGQDCVGRWPAHNE